MGARKKVKKKKIEPKVAKNADELPYQELAQVQMTLVELNDVKAQLSEAIECLKHYTKKDQVGELANPAIELLTKWGYVV